MREPPSSGAPAHHRQHRCRPQAPGRASAQSQADVVLYRCLDRDRAERLRAEHVLLIAAIVSPGSETQDTTDKPGEYAKAGIQHYWIVRLDGTGISMIERYRLDRAFMLYKHVGTFMKEETGDPPSVTNPIPITIDWPALEF